MQPSRRTVLRSGLVAAGATASLTVPQLRATAAAVTPRTDPFALGVASGDPDPTSVVLWTRLAVDPDAEDGQGGMPGRTYPLEWEVAEDVRFRRVVRRGLALASPAYAHAVHVEARGLRPGREYYYRFRTGRHVSPTGRTLTAPAPFGRTGSLAMAFVSCSQYEHGWFTAYRRLAEDHPDLVLHLGDYQYEYKAGDYVAASGNVRDHDGPETVTLPNYRQRYSQYHADLDLQAAHHAAPWLVVFDDHEVDNNWADETPEHPEDAPGFPARRAAAFRAYYENMPLRPRSVPRGPDIQVYRRLQWGRLATFHMLDTRQFRDDQACGDGYDDCPDADLPQRSLPGAEEEAWLADGFRRSRARWDVIGQQVFYGKRDSTATPDNTVSMDAWDGYRPSRQRVTDSWVKAGVRNPVVLTGDVHAHWASDVYACFDATADRDVDQSIVGAEFIASSITSGGDGYDEPTGQHPWAAWNPNLNFWTNLRGYVNTTITPEHFTADFRCVPKVSVKDQPAFTRASFVVDDGVRGMRQTASNPLLQAATLAPRTDAQKIRDTIAAETA
ncbi:alkaline phosphatase [Nocardioides mangrovicus]|uniref:Alkaline phosphatase n=1 Tax=Nocardioides mangrovicus TaxID=2478913 RepID=A0A3L8P7C0_9ACTN|nr:alkaline phosphatase D family protein [Nocardioides mangrovicus]RLV51115.1 alkaline phosphatase [Nocardioides mangrovicus]